MTPNEIAELEVQKKINEHIDNFKSFRFNAGAGSGKTYALIETLKYVTVNKISVRKSPQKLVCITYTNVAVNEIRSRLGSSGAVLVSTIHERLWEIIKRSQPQLLICHKEKIEEVIGQSNQDLYESEKANFFIDLGDDQKQKFVEFAKQTEDIFYDSKKLNAASFRSFYENNTEVGSFNGCLRNIGNFKYVVRLLYKIQRLEECLGRIERGEEKRVNYDSKVNIDRLHYMKFSHDTLLKYSLQLIGTYPTLCRIIIDSYPYFFIDEYQDTHSNVIKFIKTIHDYALKNNKNWMVGYFGDTAQSIYDDGVGRKIACLHNDLVNIDKIFNRRSHKQIIDIANNIRADEIVQVPIFEERSNGSASFFYNDSEPKLTIAQKFLAEYRNDLIKDNDDLGNEENKIHCLVLTNRLMASFNRFGDVYEAYQQSVIYYENLNTQVLSHELEKLNPTVLIIYHLIKLYQDIQVSEVSYYDVFGESSKNMTFSKASLAIRELKNKEAVSFKDWIDLIVDLLKNENIKEALGKALINRINYEQDSVSSSELFQETLLDSINALMNESIEDEVQAKERIETVLALPITSLINWVNFIDGIEASDITYHTYHGTKGEEYKNVAIILEHSFGSKNRNKFKNYFNVIKQGSDERERLRSDLENKRKHINKLNLLYDKKGILRSDLENKRKHINTQNLLYVACSRAIKNLRVLYLDDISEIREGVDSIFGTSRPWQVQVTTDEL